MEKRAHDSSPVFALDVGTRKVAGLWVAKGGAGAKGLAHVAVAGRALMTAEHSVSLKSNSKSALTREQVLMMELQAVKESKTGLKDPRASAGSYCVGYNVTRLALDGQPLQALEGHTGES